MKNYFLIIISTILLLGCMRTWDEAHHAAINRDTRSNIFSDDLRMIYVGVNSDKDKEYYR